jgi:hypothetical protein
VLCVVALLTRTSWWWLAAAVVLVSVVVLLILDLRAGAASRRWVIADHVRTHGVQAVGRVVKVRVKSTEGIRTRWKIRVDFQDETGHSCHVRHSYPYNAARRPQVGERWRLRYDPAHAHRSSHVVMLGPVRGQSVANRYLDDRDH